MRYWLGVLGIAAGDRWLEEPKAELPQDFIERLSGELREAQADGALLALEAASAGDAIARVIDARTQARRAKDWAASDRLRDALARCGVEVKDTKEGTTWTVVSSA
jgi:cysteinyl-tRNA synthetase